MPRRSNAVEQGVGRILATLSKPKMIGFISAYLAEVQRIEDAAWDVIEAFDLDTGPEWVVAIIGRIVNRGKGSFTLAQFRALVRAQVAINVSRGLTEDFFKVARLMVNNDPAGVSFSLLRVGTKHIKITQLGPYPTIGALPLWSGFLSARASATRLVFVYQPSGETLSFKYAPFGSTWPGAASTTRGYAWSDGTGGHYAGGFST